jgi:hypothetical protein|tara:strand:- start:585 stop:842 length:258 start_codon:yes stop_codon:yes gene_type:complete
MIKQKKVTKQELESINTIKEQQNTLINNLGLAEYQLKFLEQQKNDLMVELSKTEIELDKLSNNLKEKYGDVSINMETGEFINENK